MNLSQLNQHQRDGVLDAEGPCMVVAGAGSGKTSVLTHRIAHLLENGVNALNILALTFTNKAANEMRKRVEDLVGEDARKLWLGTFHSIFLRILRFENHLIGFTKNFTIYDTDDSKSLLADIIKEFHLDDKFYKPNVVFARISSAKNRLISHTAYLENPLYKEEDARMYKPRLGDVYKEYVERCARAGAMDFDDLLFYTNKLFLENPEVLEKYRNIFRYILVDEFQDTNVAQYAIVKKLAAVHKNICVVGDDAQSIYAFRGADIQNILNFEKDFPGLKIIKLEQNYRSTKSIVAAANSIINQNKKQIKKKVWTENTDGDKIQITETQTDAEEGVVVANSIFENRCNLGLRNTDFAILYRTNSQSRAIEEALRRKNIPYRIVGGMSFYQRKEVKDLLAYLKLVVNPDDEESLKRIINVPKRSIGLTTLEKLTAVASEQKKSLWQVMLQAKDILQSAAARRVEEFTLLMRSFMLKQEEQDVFALASEVAQKSGLLKELYEDKTVEGRSRYDNVQELLNGIKNFSVNHHDQEPRGTLGTFLQEISLVSAVDEKDKLNPQDVVTLMTVHSSKGLEFEQVHVVGIEEELFPSTLMINTAEDMEEERRLFYVAVTRAKSKLFLSYAQSRYRFGQIKMCRQSRFLLEIDPSCVVSHKSSRPTLKSYGVASDSQKKSLNYKVDGKNFIVDNTTTMKYRSFDDASELAVGMQVTHPSFNLGIVTKIENTSTEPRVVVKFRNFGEKVLLLKYANLRIVSQH